MTVRACKRCGASLVGMNPRAKFCSAACRSAAHRGAPAVDEPAVVSGSADGELVVATRAALTEAGQGSTPLGVAALVLARRLDRSLADTGSAVAALTRELRATLTAALADSTEAGDGVDDLAKRREEKLARAART